MASIKKRGNSYRVIVSNGRDMSGKQIIETATFTPDPEKTEKQNQKALDIFALEFEQKVKSGKYLDGEKLKYADYIPLWLKDYAQKQMEQTSIERCESSLNGIIIPAIGHLKMAGIMPLHIQGLYDNLLEKGYMSNGTKKQYSNNTIKRIHQIISSTLSIAVQWQLIESNPCQRVKPPKVEKSANVKHFTLEEAQIFLKELDKPYTVSHCGRQRKDGSPSAKHYETKNVPLQYKVFFHMALFGGFRRGELIALKWSDIDFNKGIVSITKSSARTKKGIITKVPKSYSSNRTVSLPLDTMKLIKSYKVEQSKYRLSLGTAWQGDNYIFIQDDGKQMDLSTPNKMFKKIVNRYNETAKEEDQLSEITLHGLRHTSATLLIAQNIDVKTVSGRLGHSECSTTMDIYAHALKKQDEIASQSLGDLFKHGS